MNEVSKQFHLFSILTSVKYCINFLFLIFFFHLFQIFLLFFIFFHGQWPLSLFAAINHRLSPPHSLATTVTTVTFSVNCLARLSLSLRRWFFSIHYWTRHHKLRLLNMKWDNTRTCAQQSEARINVKQTDS